MSRNDVILGIVAAVLVVFSLVVALVVPSRNPSFPGRHLRLFVLVAVLLVVGMLTAVEVLGESHHFGEAAAETEAAPTAGTTTGAAPTETGGGGQPQGNPEAGKEIFTATAQPVCSSCHTLQEAGATQTIGPNLDDVLKGKDAAFIHQSIVDPNAVIAKGYPPNVMPGNFGSTLSKQQIDALVQYLSQVTK